MSQSTKKKLSQTEIEKLSYQKILKKNSIVVSNLPKTISNKKILSKYKYFGQYGNITKILISKVNQTSFIATVSYQSPREAALAFLANDMFVIDGKSISVSYCVVKYCNNFLSNKDCNNKDCNYLHELSDGIVTTVVESSGLSSHKTVAMKILGISKEVYEKVILKKINELNIANQQSTGLTKSNLICFPEITFDLISCHNENGEENMEYVLVRQTKQGNKGKNYKKKRKFFKSSRRMTDYAEPEIIRKFEQNGCNNKEIERENTVPHRKLTYEKNEIGHLMFKRNEKSRFDFVNENCYKKEHCVDIPEYVYELIDEKIKHFFSDEIWKNECKTKNDSNIDKAWRDIILGKE